MRLSNGYNALQILLHWTIALLIVAQLITGDAMSEVFERVREVEGEGARGTDGLLHMLFGATILVLATVRVIARAMYGVPPSSPASPRWDVRLSRASHMAMYVLLFAVPLAGLNAWISKSEAAGELHVALKSLLVLIVLAHIAGALWHHFFLKDHLIRRMMRPNTE